MSKTTPQTLLAGQMVPNFGVHVRVAARNQTLVNEAQIVCALERYHLVNGNYP